MVKVTTGKLKTPIEIQHLNGEVTFCFVFLDDPNSLYSYITSAVEFLPVMILSNEIIYIAKSDIKAFRVFDNDNPNQENHIWSFDPYKVLGIDNKINLNDLHEHYIDTLKKVHPDVIDTMQLHPAFKDIASDITRRIISAYEFIRAEKISEENLNE